MIAVDTNILVFAHRAESPFFDAAGEAIRELMGLERLWAIPWPCLHEFYSVITHPRVFKTPTPREEAIHQIEALLACPALQLIGETEDHWPLLRRLITSGRIDGPQIHDARIAAICLGHGVDLLWSADRDFSRYEGIKVKNPLI